MAQTFPLPYFLIYVEEMLSDEDFCIWTATQRGIWLTLIAHCWREGSIPSNEKILAGWCNMEPKDFSKQFIDVSTKFSIVFEDTPRPRLVSPRLEHERAKALDRFNSMTKRGQAGALTRWKKHQNP